MPTNSDDLLFATARARVLSLGGKPVTDISFPYYIWRYNRVTQHNRLKVIKSAKPLLVPRLPIGAFTGQ